MTLVFFLTKSNKVQDSVLALGKLKWLVVSSLKGSSGRILHTESRRKQKKVIFLFSILCKIK